MEDVLLEKQPGPVKTAMSLGQETCALPLACWEWGRVRDLEKHSTFVSVCLVSSYIKVKELNKTIFF